MRKYLRALLIGSMFIPMLGCGGGSSKLPTASKSDGTAPDTPPPPPTVDPSASNKVEQSTGATDAKGVLND